MKHRSLIATFAAVVLSLSLSANAEVRMAGIFSDNMILQRDMKVPVWGWADPGEEVTVSFAGQTKSTKADKGGKWMVRLDKLDASAEGRELKAGKQVCKNVVVGEVWLCSGQSNMEWKLTSTANGGDFAKKANFPNIRLVTTPRKALKYPISDLDLQWQICSPSTIGGFSSVGYHFGRKLHEELDVPVGLINSSWGGTKVEPWTPPEGFAKVKELSEISEKLETELPGSKAQQKAAEETIKHVKAWLSQAEVAVENKELLPVMPEIPTAKVSHQDPTRIYNAKIHPIVPFGIKGAIWYQGESNRKDGTDYFFKKKALIEGGREIWDYELPFYFVQLASWKQDKKDPEGGDGWAPLWEAQVRTMSLPKTGMASAVDLLDKHNPNDIHPKNKMDVGYRLARWALANDYGQKDLVTSGPIYKSHKVKGNTIEISFDYVGGGLMVGKKDGMEPTVEDTESELKRFSVSDKEGKWHWADAKIEGDKVIVSCKDVAEPVAARYAFTMNPAGLNLYNKDGLPASPFRTDTGKLIVKD